MKIDVIDYGVGNLASVFKAFACAGAEPVRVDDSFALAHTRAIVIPGVGHFDATRVLDQRWRSALRDAIGRGAPVLGICLGMQWLFDGSREAPTLSGLGALRGMCGRLGEDVCDVGLGNVKVPHVGWNSLDRTARESRLLEGIRSGSFAYFTHSYAAPVSGDASATTTHGVPFASVVERANVFGVQWHPEKSGDTGIRLLVNFVRIAEAVSC